MFIKKIKTPKGKIFIQIVEGYRGEYGTISHKVIQSLGYLEELDNAHNGNGLDWAKEQLKKLRQEKNEITKPIEIKSNQMMEQNKSKKRYIGALALNPIYDNLEIDKVCNAIQQKYSKFGTSINSIFKFFIQSRLIDHDSRLSSYNKIEQYLDGFTFSEDQMYRCMEYIGKSWEQIKDFVTRKSIEKYKIDTSISHYDGCNFYFEIDQEDNLRRKGMSKEGRKEPIVNFGMLSDKDLIPYDIVIYPGNESEQSYFSKVIIDLKKKYKIKKIIYVADKGLNSGTNLINAIKTGNGYIVGQAIRSEMDKKFVKNDYGFKLTTDKNGCIIKKIKSFIDKEAVIHVLNEEGKKIDLKIPQKQIVIWSKDYADKQKRERAKLINKAKAFISSPKEYSKNKIGDASVYIQFATFDKDGNYIEKANIKPALNLEKIKEQESLDGYFFIVSSETTMSDEEILRAYSEQKGLERNFRVNKTYLKIRPVYVSRELRIKTHVLVCYITTILLKLIEVKVLKNEIPIEQIIDDLRNYEAALIAPNTYFFFQYSDTVKKLAELSGGNAMIETQSLSSIKKLFKNY